MLDNVSLAGLALASVTVVLAVVERIRTGGLSTVPRLESDPAPLRLAAEMAYDYVKAWRLPLAAVAERKGRSGDAVVWFENSMLKAVPVSAASVKSGTVKTLSAITRATMHAVPDGIARSFGDEAVYSNPTISAKDFRAYMRWARTVW